jgi:hypothetical protein
VHILEGLTNDDSETVSLVRLPLELRGLIAARLSCTSACSFARASCACKEAALTDDLWRPFFRERWGVSHPLQPSAGGWRAAHISAARAEVRCPRIEHGTFTSRTLPIPCRPLPLT